MVVKKGDWVKSIVVVLVLIFMFQIPLVSADDDTVESTFKVPGTLGYGKVDGKSYYFMRPDFDYRFNASYNGLKGVTFELKSANNGVISQMYYELDGLKQVPNYYLIHVDRKDIGDSMRLVVYGYKVEDSSKVEIVDADILIVNDCEANGGTCIDTDAYSCGSTMTSTSCANSFNSISSSFVTGDSGSCCVQSPDQVERNELDKFLKVTLGSTASIVSQFFDVYVVEGGNNLFSSFFEKETLYTGEIGIEEDFVRVKIVPRPSYEDYISGAYESVKINFENVYGTYNFNVPSYFRDSFKKVFDVRVIFGGNDQTKYKLAYTYDGSTTPLALEGCHYESSTDRTICDYEEDRVPFFASEVFIQSEGVKVDSMGAASTYRTEYTYDATDLLCTVTLTVRPDSVSDLSVYVDRTREINVGSDGKFTFDVVPYTSHGLRISGTGYETLDEDFICSANTLSLSKRLSELDYSFEFTGAPDGSNSNILATPVDPFMVSGASNYMAQGEDYSIYFVHPTFTQNAPILCKTPVTFTSVPVTRFAFSDCVWNTDLFFRVATNDIALFEDNNVVERRIDTTNVLVKGKPGDEITCGNGQKVALAFDLGLECMFEETDNVDITFSGLYSGYFDYYVTIDGTEYKNRRLIPREDISGLSVRFVPKQTFNDGLGIVGEVYGTSSCGITDDTCDFGSLLSSRVDQFSIGLSLTYLSAGDRQETTVNPSVSMDTSSSFDYYSTLNNLYSLDNSNCLVQSLTLQNLFSSGFDVTLNCDIGNQYGELFDVTFKDGKYYVQAKNRAGALELVFNDESKLSDFARNGNSWFDSSLEINQKRNFAFKFSDDVYGFAIGTSYRSDKEKSLYTVKSSSAIDYVGLPSSVSLYYVDSEGNDVSVISLSKQDFVKMMFYSIESPEYSVDNLLNIEKTTFTVSNYNEFSDYLNFGVSYTLGDDTIEGTYYEGQEYPIQDLNLVVSAKNGFVYDADPRISFASTIAVDGSKILADAYLFSDSLWNVISTEFSGENLIVRVNGDEIYNSKISSRPKELIPINLNQVFIQIGSESKSWTTLPNVRATDLNGVFDSLFSDMNILSGLSDNAVPNGRFEFDNQITGSPDLDLSAVALSDSCTGTNLNWNSLIVGEEYKICYRVVGYHNDYRELGSYDYSPASGIVQNVVISDSDLTDSFVFPVTTNNPVELASQNSECAQDRTCIANLGNSLRCDSGSGVLVFGTIECNYDVASSLSSMTEQFFIRFDTAVDSADVSFSPRKDVDVTVTQLDSEGSTITMVLIKPKSGVDLSGSAMTVSYEIGALRDSYTFSATQLNSYYTSTNYLSNGFKVIPLVIDGSGASVGGDSFTIEVSVDGANTYDSFNLIDSYGTLKVNDVELTSSTLSTLFNDRSDWVYTPYSEYSYSGNKKGKVTKDSNLITLTKAEFKINEIQLLSEQKINEIKSSYGLDSFDLELNCEDYSKKVSSSSNVLKNVPIRLNDCSLTLKSGGFLGLFQTSEITYTIGVISVSSIDEPLIKNSLITVSFDEMSMQGFFVLDSDFPEGIELYVVESSGSCVSKQMSELTSLDTNGNLRVNQDYCIYVKNQNFNQRYLSVYDEATYAGARTQVVLYDESKFNSGKISVRTNDDSVFRTKNPSCWSSNGGFTCPETVTTFNCDYQELTNDYLICNFGTDSIISVVLTGSVKDYFKVQVKRPSRSWEDSNQLLVGTSTEVRVVPKSGSSYESCIDAYNVLIPQGKTGTYEVDLDSGVLQYKLKVPAVTDQETSLPIVDGSHDYWSNIDASTRAELSQVYYLEKVDNARLFGLSACTLDLEMKSDVYGTSEPISGLSVDYCTSTSCTLTGGSIEVVCDNVGSVSEEEFAQNLMNFNFIKSDACTVSLANDVKVKFTASSGISLSGLYQSASQLGNTLNKELIMSSGTELSKNYDLDITYKLLIRNSEVRDSACNDLATAPINCYVDLSTVDNSVKRMTFEDVFETLLSSSTILVEEQSNEVNQMTDLTIRNFQDLLRYVSADVEYADGSTQNLEIYTNNEVVGDIVSINLIPNTNVELISDSDCPIDNNKFIVSSSVVSVDLSKCENNVYVNIPPFSSSFLTEIQDRTTGELKVSVTDGSLTVTGLATFESRMIPAFTNGQSLVFRNGAGLEIYREVLDYNIDPLAAEAFVLNDFDYVDGERIVSVVTTSDRVPVEFRITPSVTDSLPDSILSSSSPVQLTLDADIEYRVDYNFVGFDDIYSTTFTPSQENSDMLSGGVLTLRFDGDEDGVIEERLNSELLPKLVTDIGGAINTGVGRCDSNGCYSQGGEFSLTSRGGTFSFNSNKFRDLIKENPEDLDSQLLDILYLKFKLQFTSITDVDFGDVNINLKVDGTSHEISPMQSSADADNVLTYIAMFKDIFGTDISSITSGTSFSLVVDFMGLTKEFQLSFRDLLTEDYLAIDAIPPTDDIKEETMHALENAIKYLFSKSTFSPSGYSVVLKSYSFSSDYSSVDISLTVCDTKENNVCGDKTFTLRESDISVSPGDSNARISAEVPVVLKSDEFKDFVWTVTLDFIATIDLEDANKVSGLGSNLQIGATFSGVSADYTLAGGTCADIAIDFQGTIESIVGEDLESHQEELKKYLTTSVYDLRGRIVNPDSVPAPYQTLSGYSYGTNYDLEVAFTSDYFRFGNSDAESKKEILNTQISSGCKVVFRDNIYYTGRLSDLGEDVGGSSCQTLGASYSFVKNGGELSFGDSLRAYLGDLRLCTPESGMNTCSGYKIGETYTVQAKDSGNSYFTYSPVEVQIPSDCTIDYTVLATGVCLPSDLEAEGLIDSQNREYYLVGSRYSLVSGSIEKVYTVTADCEFTRSEVEGCEFTDDYLRKVFTLSSGDSGACVVTSDFTDTIMFTDDNEISLEDIKSKITDWTHVVKVAKTYPSKANGCKVTACTSYVSSGSYFVDDVSKIPESCSGSAYLTCGSFPTLTAYDGSGTAICGAGKACTSLDFGGEEIPYICENTDAGKPECGLPFRSEISLTLDLRVLLTEDYLNQIDSDHTVLKLHQSHTTETYSVEYEQMLNIPEGGTVVTLTTGTEEGAEYSTDFGCDLDCSMLNLPSDVTCEESSTLYFGDIPTLKTEDGSAVTYVLNYDNTKYIRVGCSIDDKDTCNPGFVTIHKSSTTNCYLDYNDYLTEIEAVDEGDTLVDDTQGALETNSEGCVKYSFKNMDDFFFNQSGTSSTCVGPRECSGFSSKDGKTFEWSERSNCDALNQAVIDPSTYGVLFTSVEDGKVCCVSLESGTCPDYVTQEGYLIKQTTLQGSLNDKGSCVYDMKCDDLTSHDNIQYTWQESSNCDPDYLPVDLANIGTADMTIVFADTPSDISDPKCCIKKNSCEEEYGPGYIEKTTESEDYCALNTNKELDDGTKCCREQVCDGLKAWTTAECPVEEQLIPARRLSGGYWFYCCNRSTSSIIRSLNMFDEIKQGKSDARALCDEMKQTFNDDEGAFVNTSSGVSIRFKMAEQFEKDCWNKISADRSVFYNGKSIAECTNSNSPYCQGVNIAIHDMRRDLISFWTFGSVIGYDKVKGKIEEIASKSSYVYGFASAIDTIGSIFGEDVGFLDTLEKWDSDFRESAAYQAIIGTWSSVVGSISESIRSASISSQLEAFCEGEGFYGADLYDSFPDLVDDANEFVNLLVSRQRYQTDQISDRLNMSEYVYLLTWSIGGLPDNITYQIWFTNDSSSDAISGTDYCYKSYSDTQFGSSDLIANYADCTSIQLQAGDSHSSPDTLKGKFVSRKYNYACIKYFEGNDLSKPYYIEEGDDIGWNLSIGVASTTVGAGDRSGNNFVCVDINDNGLGIEYNGDLGGDPYAIYSYEEDNEDTTDTTDEENNDEEFTSTDVSTI